MKADPRLHHSCFNIARGSLESAIGMFSILDCEVVYRPKGDASWVMVGQKQLRFALQLAEISGDPIKDIRKKCGTHVAFISDDPQAIIDKVGSWAKKEGIAFRGGGWSEIERYFDLPDIFMDFVVEVMHTSIEKE
jgi:hypothetical protein